MLPSFDDSTVSHHSGSSSDTEELTTGPVEPPLARSASLLLNPPVGCALTSAPRADSPPKFGYLRDLRNNSMALGGDDSTAEQDEEWQDIHNQLREAIAIREGEEQDAEDEEEGWQDVTNGALLGVFECCEAGHDEELAGILEEYKDLDINMAGPDGDTALNLACLYGNLGCVKVLLERGAETNIINEEDGSSVLHDAAAGGYLDICKIILERSPELVKVADEDGDTPLHNAARGNHAEVVSLLLSFGADPKAVNKDGSTPAGEAEEEEVLQILEKAVAASSAAEEGN